MVARHYPYISRFKISSREGEIRMPRKKEIDAVIEIAKTVNWGDPRVYAGPMGVWSYRKYDLEVRGYAQDERLASMIPSFPKMLSIFRKSDKYSRYRPEEYRDFMWGYLDERFDESICEEF